VKTYRKRRVWFSGFNTLGLLVSWRLREDEGDSERQRLKRYENGEGASLSVFKGGVSHVCFLGGGGGGGGGNVFPQKTVRNSSSSFLGNDKIHHLKRDK
jgi:hypothetical protein